MNPYTDLPQILSGELSELDQLQKGKLVGKAGLPILLINKIFV